MSKKELSEKEIRRRGLQGEYDRIRIEAGKVVYSYDFIPARLGHRIISGLVLGVVVLII